MAHEAEKVYPEAVYDVQIYKNDPTKYKVIDFTIVDKQWKQWRNK